MSNNRTIKVFLVDDHPVVRSGYRRLLDNTPDIEVVAEAGSGEEVYELYSDVRPDVVVLDLNMPGIGGMETITRLRARHPDVTILVFSMHDNKTMVSRAIEAGAKGFLNKSSASTQMIDAVRSVFSGKLYLESEIMQEMFEKLQSHVTNPLDDLTRREFEVFRRLAEGDSVTDIAMQLSISPKTAGVHQTNIMKKLKLRNASELTRLAIRCGIINA
jgi:two-component system invasion response regulator UvrY